MEEKIIEKYDKKYFDICIEKFIFIFYNEYIKFKLEPYNNRKITTKEVGSVLSI